MPRTGVLLIHGLMGSPKEYEVLEAALWAQGFATRCVTLPGHGERPAQTFFETSSGDLITHCCAEYEKLLQSVDEVYIVGHSLGGLCTLLTAASAPPRLKGAVALAAPCEHAFFFNHVKGLLHMPFRDVLAGLSFYPEVNTGLERPDYKLWMLPKLLRETRDIFRQLQIEIANIEVPLCLAHSPYDLTVPYAEMQKIAERVARPDWVLQHTLSECGHQIFPKSRERDRVTRLVLDFIEDQAPRIWAQEMVLEIEVKHPAKN